MKREDGGGGVAIGTARGEGGVGTWPYRERSEPDYPLRIFHVCNLFFRRKRNLSHSSNETITVGDSPASSAPSDDDDLILPKEWQTSNITRRTRSQTKVEKVNSLNFCKFVIA